MRGADVLVLGGTQFVGRAVVEEALARGWSVTTFNRGSRPPHPGVVALHGDRTAPRDLGVLAAGSWDVVVDTWSWAPSAVRDAAGALRDRAGVYAYISSRSVYRFPTPAGATEGAPLVDGDPDAGATDYASAKAGGERAVLEAFGDRALLVRAGLILGPYEDVGRLPWWLLRAARGGPMLAPGPPDAGLQFVDARDLAAWTLSAASRRLGGAFDVVSPPDHATVRQLLERCVAVTGARAELRWVEPERILAAGVEPWTDLPIWLPPGELYDALHRADTSKARAAGLTCRPYTETVDDTWAWLQRIGGRPPRRPDRPAVGLSPEVEERLLGPSG